MLSSTKKKAAAVAVMTAMLLAGFGTMAAEAHRVPACDNSNGNAPNNNPHCQPGHPDGPGEEPGEEPGEGEGDDNSVVIIDNDFLDLDILNDVLDITVGDILSNNGDILTNYGEILTNNGDILTGDILTGDILTGDILSGNSIVVEDVADVCTISHDGNGGSGNGPGDTYNDCDVLDLGSYGDDVLGLDVMADVFALIGLF